MIYKNPDKLITARRVAGLLAETKMSQERYAKMLHLSQPAISGKLSGTVKFTANDIWKTAVIFGVSTDYLYGLESVDELQLTYGRRMKPIQHYQAE